MICILTSTLHVDLYASHSLNRPKADSTPLVLLLTNNPPFSEILDPPLQNQYVARAGDRSPRYNTKLYCIMAIKTVACCSNVHVLRMHVCLPNVKGDTPPPPYTPYPTPARIFRAYGVGTPNDMLPRVSLRLSPAALHVA